MNNVYSGLEVVWTDSNYRFFGVESLDPLNLLLVLPLLLLHSLVLLLRLQLRVMIDTAEGDSLLGLLLLGLSGLLGGFGLRLIFLGPGPLILGRLVFVVDWLLFLGLLPLSQDPGGRLLLHNLLLLLYLNFLLFLLSSLGVTLIGGNIVLLDVSRILCIALDSQLEEVAHDVNLELTLVAFLLLYLLPGLVVVEEEHHPIVFIGRGHLKIISNVVPE